MFASALCLVMEVTDVVTDFFAAINSTTQAIIDGLPPGRFMCIIRKCCPLFRVCIFQNYVMYYFRYQMFVCYHVLEYAQDVGEAVAVAGVGKHTPPLPPPLLHHY